MSERLSPKTPNGAHLRRERRAIVGFPFSVDNENGSGSSPFHGSIESLMEAMDPLPQKYSHKQLCMHYVLSTLFIEIRLPYLFAVHIKN